jgi:hypothetical protein
MINSDAQIEIPDVFHPHHICCNSKNCKTFETQTIPCIHMSNKRKHRKFSYFSFIQNCSLHILNFYPFNSYKALIGGTQWPPLPSFKIDVPRRNRYITFSLSLKSLFQCPL